MHYIVFRTLNTLPNLCQVSPSATIKSKAPFLAWFLIFLVMFSCSSKVISSQDQKYTLNSFTQLCCNQVLKPQFKQLQSSNFQMETHKSRENREDILEPKSQLFCRISFPGSSLEALFWMSPLLRWNNYLHFQNPFNETWNFQSLKF